MTMGGALAGLRVAAFTHFAAGPLAAQYLGALGADVVKVEGPALDVNRSAVRDPDDRLHGVSPYFLVTNRNQRCLGLDLKTPAGRAVAGRLIARADILLENYRPGVMDRLGLGYDAVRQGNGRLIYCSLSAYDSSGPGRDRPGQDLLIQALSGLASLSGRASGPPVPVGAYLIDGFTAMQGLVGILAALRYRDATGQGQRVRVDMMSTALYMMAQEASYLLNTGLVPERSRNGIAHVHQAAPYGIYGTADGSVALSVFGNVEAVGRAAEVFGIRQKVAQYLSEAGLKSGRDAVAAAFAAALAGMTTAEAIARLTPTGVWAVPVRSLAEALADPAVAGAGLVREVHANYGGSHRVVIEPVKLSGAPIAHHRPAPAPGEHTIEILEELGFSGEEATGLVRQGAAFAAG
jgi:crotonobetainyl-CoA:carnitine CoA-transferase CaiB-like acyl-CoA transferase